MRGGVGIEREGEDRAEHFHFFIPAVVTEVSGEKRQCSNFLHLAKYSHLLCFSFGAAAALLKQAGYRDGSKVGHESTGTVCDRREFNRVCTTCKMATETKGNGWNYFHC